MACSFQSPYGPQLILIINFFTSELRHRESLSKANESFVFYEGFIYATAPNSRTICSGRHSAREGIKRDPPEMACFITGSAAKLSARKKFKFPNFPIFKVSENASFKSYQFIWKY